MSKFNYKCSNCELEINGSSNRDEIIYLCPACGKAERNRPLIGVLNIDYDYDELKKIVSVESLYNSKIGNYKSYEQILPLSGINDDINIRLNPKIYPIIFETREIKIFDDTLNPTLSYKDRATLLVCYKAIEMGISDISAASTGNAGSSLAGIAAKLGLNSHIFVPKRIPDAKRLQIQSFGANIYMVDGTYDDAFDLCTEISLLNGWYNRNTAYNPFTIEGKKTAAFDIFIETKGKLPDSIIVSVGDGVICAGLYKGFYDLIKLGLIDKIPQIIAVQSEGSNALVRYMKEGVFNYLETNTIADSIDAAAPRNLYLAGDAVKGSSGIAIDVADDEIIEAQKIMVSKYGIMCEPSAAAVFAVYLKLNREGVNQYLNNTMLMITGNGLKDTDSLRLWNKKPISKSADEWRNTLGK